MFVLMPLPGLLNQRVGIRVIVLLDGRKLGDSGEQPSQRSRELHKLLVSSGLLLHNLHNHNESQIQVGYVVPNEVA